MRGDVQCGGTMGLPAAQDTGFAVCRSGCEEAEE